MSEVIQFPTASHVLSCAERERLEAFRSEGPFWFSEDEAAALGTPDEWLGSAVLYLKNETSREDYRMQGAAYLSLAAIDAVLIRLEELEQGR